MRVLVLALLVAACTQPAEQVETPAAAPSAQSAEAALAATPSWEEARAAGIDFRAVGQEPGWILDIYTQSRMRLMWDYGENSAEFTPIEPDTAQEGVTRYETRANGRTLRVTIRRSPCQDTMSGEPYPAAVEIVIDGRTLQGCGKNV